LSRKVTVQTYYNERWWHPNYCPCHNVCGMVFIVHDTTETCIPGHCKH